MISYDENDDDDDDDDDAGGGGGGGGGGDGDGDGDDDDDDGGGGGGGDGDGGGGGDGGDDDDDNDDDDDDDDDGGLVGRMLVRIMILIFQRADDDAAGDGFYCHQKLASMVVQMMKWRSHPTECQVPFMRLANPCNILQGGIPFAVNVVFRILLD